MIRFLTFLFNKQYEPCKSCQTLKEQLLIANTEKKDMLDTILSFTKPPVVEDRQVLHSLNPIGKAIPWRIRRAKLEAESRNEAIRKKQHEEEIEKLEKELGVDDALRQSNE